MCLKLAEPIRSKRVCVFSCDGPVRPVCQQSLDMSCFQVKSAYKVPYDARIEGLKSAAAAVKFSSRFELDSAVASAVECSRDVLFQRKSSSGINLA